jgi:MFS superfamily sulfate permease-like transporter
LESFIFGAAIAINNIKATWNSMLRITRTACVEVVFRLSGKLTAENVSEMDALISAEKEGKRIVLDCTDLRSANGDAVKLLEQWETDSVTLKNCGLYIRELIRRERLEKNRAGVPRRANGD